MGVKTEGQLCNEKTWPENSKAVCLKLNTN